MEYLNEQTKLEHPECRCDTPNNIGASNIRPNTPDPNIACPTPICPNPMRLWVIKYAITGTAKFIGQAIVQAPTIEQAQCIFGKDSRFNGYVDRLKITCCHEVFPHPEPILLQEDCVAIIDRRNLKTYPFILKSDFDNVISDVYASIAKIIEDTKKEVYNGLEGDNYITIEVASDYSTCVISHADSGVTAGEYGDILEEQQESKTPDFGDSVKIMSLIVDSQGHITEIEDHLVTIPDTEATQSLHGLMSALDKQKLDEIGINTTNTTALTPANELFNNVIQLHKIAKTGTFSDLLNIPDGVLTINYPKGDGTTETKTFTDNADTNETVTIPSEIDDTLAQDYKTYSSNKIEDFVDESIGKGTLIIQKNGTDLPVSYGNNQSKQSFGANDYDACIVNIPVPTKTSDLTNDGSDAQNPNPYINKDASNLTNYYTKTSIDNLLSELEASIDWKEAVATYNDIATTYPNPQDGWTVSTKDTNNVYRYDDTTQTWVNVFSANSNNVEPSTGGVGGHSGLMPATMAEKLNGIEAGAEVNVQPDWNQSTTTADDYIKNKPTIGNGKLTVTINNDPNNKLEFTANQTNDTTFNINTETNIFRTAIQKTGNNVDVLYDNEDWGIGVNSSNQLKINGKFVKQIEGFSDYTNPTVGDVVQYIGNTNSDYTHNYFYEYQELTPAEYDYEITVGPNDYGIQDGVYESQDPPAGIKIFNIAHYIDSNDEREYYGPPTHLLKVGSKVWSYTGDNIGIFTVTSADRPHDQYILNNGDVLSCDLDNIEQQYIYAVYNNNVIALNKSELDAKCVANGFQEFEHSNVYFADVKPFFNSTNEGLEEYINIEKTMTIPATYGWVQTDVQPAQQLGDLASINTNGDTTQYLRGDGTWSTIPSSVTIWEGTLAQYNQISPKDPNTIYLISD